MSEHHDTRRAFLHSSPAADGEEALRLFRGGRRMWCSATW